MKKLFLVWMALVAIVLCFGCPMVATAEPLPVEVYLGGTQLGINLVGEGMQVMGFAWIDTPQGPYSAAQAAGMQVGDVLVSVDGMPIHTRYDVQQSLNRAAGEAVVLTVWRDGDSHMLTAHPVRGADGNYMLGVYLKEGLQGIGTLTFVRPETHVYAALGHGIEDSDMSTLPQPYHGAVYATTVSGIIKGAIGQPGELQGTVLNGAPVGNILANTPLGLYGQALPSMYEGLGKVQVAPREEVHEGDAVVVCALGADKPRYFAARITQCRKQTSPQTKGLSIAITDNRLLSLTGGIVQGMSGSPILQDGRLVGAVTHVTVGNPAEGYGVYIDFMLQQSEGLTRP